MKYLIGYEIKLGAFKSNEKFHEDGGWINGVLTNGVKSFSVGGGWIHNKDGANHYNSCHGFSYSGGGPNPYRQALSAGGFEPYSNFEMGDLNEVYTEFGFDEDENPDECEVIYEEILELNEKAWADFDCSEDVEYQTLVHSKAEIIQNIKELIEEDDADRAKFFVKVANLKGINFEICDNWEDENESDGVIYKTITRKLFASNTEIAEWTICAQGWYINTKDNPNYSIGWNTDENTDGGDGISPNSALYDVLDELNLLDEAKELPEINEPEHEEESKDGEFICEVRNTYTSGMEDWEIRARFDTEEGAKFWEADFWRGFYSANSSNSYGPETRIRVGDEILEEIS